MNTTHLICSYAHHKRSYRHIRYSSHHSSLIYDKLHEIGTMYEISARTQPLRTGVIEESITTPHKPDKHVHKTEYNNYQRMHQLEARLEKGKYVFEYEECDRVGNREDGFPIVISVDSIRRDLHFYPLLHRLEGQFESIQPVRFTFYAGLNEYEDRLGKLYHYAGECAYSIWHLSLVILDKLLGSIMDDHRNDIRFFRIVLLRFSTSMQCIMDVIGLKKKCKRLETIIWMIIGCSISERIEKLGVRKTISFRNENSQTFLDILFRLRTEMDLNTLYQMVEKKDFDRLETLAKSITGQLSHIVGYKKELKNIVRSITKEFINIGVSRECNYLYDDLKTFVNKERNIAESPMGSDPYFTKARFRIAKCFSNSLHEISFLNLFSRYFMNQEFNSPNQPKINYRAQYLKSGDYPIVVDLKQSISSTISKEYEIEVEKNGIINLCNIRQKRGEIIKIAIKTSHIVKGPFRSEIVHEQWVVIWEIPSFLSNQLRIPIAIFLITDLQTLKEINLTDFKYESVVEKEFLESLYGMSCYERSEISMVDKIDSVDDEIYLLNNSIKSISFQNINLKTEKSRTISIKYNFFKDANRRVCVIYSQLMVEGSQIYLLMKISDKLSMKTFDIILLTLDHQKGEIIREKIIEKNVGNEIMETPVGVYRLIRKRRDVIFCLSVNPSMALRIFPVSPLARNRMPPHLSTSIGYFNRICKKIKAPPGETPMSGCWIYLEQSKQLVFWMVYSSNYDHGKASKLCYRKFMRRVHVFDIMI